MVTLQALYTQAQEQNITVDRLPLTKREALSLMEPDGSCFICLDPQKLRSQAEERTKLGHELGHCFTGSFYNRYAAIDCRQKHENRADRWEIQRLIPVEELDSAVASGCTELWELAEHFGVTEEFMRKAVCLYTYGNLAAELYF